MALSTFNSLTLTDRPSSLLWREQGQDGPYFRRREYVIDQFTRGYVGALHRIIAPALS